MILVPTLRPPGLKIFLGSQYNRQCDPLAYYRAESIPRYDCVGQRFVSTSVGHDLDREWPVEASERFVVSQAQDCFCHG